MNKNINPERKMKVTKTEAQKLLEGLYSISSDAERYTCPLIKRLEAVVKERA